MPVAVLLAFSLADAPAVEPTRVSFQQGVGGYAAAVDTELWAISPNQILLDNETLTSDGNNGGGESQILIRFGEVFGTRPGQVPPGSSILSATLTVTAFDPGNTVNLHRILVPWPASATWNSLVAGLTADGTEALRDKEGFTFGKLANDKQDVSFDVRDTVQAWADGAGDYGWLFLNTGGNGWDFYSCDHPEVPNRPRLVIEYTPRR